MFFLFGVFFGCRPPLEIDATWDVTVTGLETTCVEDTTRFLKSYTYDIVYDGTRAKIYIDNTIFAVGDQRGCSLKYTSSIYLEDSAEGDFTWYVDGEAIVQGAAGGCDVQEGFDWDGTETLRVRDSENPNIEEGCTYTMTVQGVFVND